jgi:SPP1 gp7 family putative phage head morphogenesis protein
LGFAISGIAKGAELESVFLALYKAEKEGIPFEAWKKSLSDVWEKRGWIGVKSWRIDNIFRTNIQTAFNVGRYRQMMQVTKTRPYWMYDAINDSRTRPAHRALDGKVFRYDHPFWDTWYPPNGYRFRCGVSTLSAREIERDGLEVETEDPTDKLFEPTTPEGMRMPARLMMPDPGFAYHPGKTAWGGLIDGAIREYGGEYAPLPGLKTAADLLLPKLADIVDTAPAIRGKLLARGLSDAEYLVEIQRRYGDGPLKDVIGDPVFVSDRAFRVVKEPKPGDPIEYKFDKAGHGEIIPFMGDIVKSPYELWLTPQKNKAGKVRLTKRYIVFLEDDEKRLGGFLSFEVEHGAFQGITAFTPLKKSGEPNWSYIERQRQGLLLYPKQTRGKGQGGSRPGS